MHTHNFEEGYSTFYAARAKIHGFMGGWMEICFNNKNSLNFLFSAFFFAILSIFIRQVNVQFLDDVWIVEILTSQFINKKQRKKIINMNTFLYTQYNTIHAHSLYANVLNYTTGFLSLFFLFHLKCIYKLIKWCSNFQLRDPSMCCLILHFCFSLGLISFPFVIPISKCSLCFSILHFMVINLMCVYGAYNSTLIGCD